MKTRREFLKTVAAGSAAAIATVATQSTAATVVKSVVSSAKRRPANAPPSHPGHDPNAERMIPAELAKQRKSTADALKVIRDYPLPAGSPMAFSFRPLKAARGRTTRQP